MVRLAVTDWRSFASEVWADPAAWEQDIWIPAPIAPHILADWVVDRIEHLTGAERMQHPSSCRRFRSRTSTQTAGYCSAMHRGAARLPASSPVRARSPKTRAGGR